MVYIVYVVALLVSIKGHVERISLECTVRVITFDWRTIGD